ncbi:MAG: insulinase family protein, partial [Candidatus Omnitrophica bacterium]|nr:insulinase family protein [Candidatus Omnitrophota bacterium]
MFELTKVKDLTFIYSPLKNIETASLGVFLGVGSRLESQQQKGIAHFLEHMVFKGTRKYSHLDIKQEIEGRGGSLNAFTSQEITAYYAHFLKKNLTKVLDILLDMVTEPLLNKKDIQRERNVILEEIKMYNDLPSSRASMLIDRLLWPNHPLGQEVIGFAKTVEKINQADLRRFQRGYYSPSRMV